MSVRTKTIRIYWQHTKKYWPLFMIGAGLVPIAILVDSFLTPLVVARVFDKLPSYQGSGQSVFTVFRAELIAFSVLAFLQVAIWRLQVYCTWLFEIKAMRDIAGRVFAHIEQLSYRFHSDHFGGALVSQANKFISSYERLMDEFIWSIITGISSFIFAMVILTPRAPLYAAILAATIILHIAGMIWRMKIQAPYNEAEASSESERTAQLADAITNIITTKSLAHESYEQKLFMAKAKQTFDASRKLMRVALFNEFINTMVINMLNIAAITCALIAVVQFNQPASTLYLIMTYTMMLLRRLWEFGRVLRNLNRGFGDATDMTEILSMKPEISDPAKPESSRIKHGHIQFNTVTFTYPESKQVLFDNFSLDIMPGEKIGLVGHSGSGKTSLTKLILRFMDVQDGAITIDGQNIAKITQADLRKNIAYVSQEPILFHRSLMENIRYGRLDASDQAVIKAAKLAHADEFIVQTPRGYKTLVGERGTKLSGGQRQRVAIARAMLSHAPILLLDEATSALDSESEKLIQESLWELMKGRTTIVIAHRLSTIQKMDRIIVLEDGAITEQGTHASLLKSKGAYADLWAHQSGGFLQE